MTLNTTPIDTIYIIPWLLFVKMLYGGQKLLCPLIIWFIQYMTNLRKWIFTVYFKVTEKKFLSFSGALAQIYQTSCPDWQSYRYRICLNCSRDFYLESQVDSPLSWPPFILNLNQTTKHTNKKQTYVWKQKSQNSRLNYLIKMLLPYAFFGFFFLDWPRYNYV